jgi:hypothetical protein
MQRASKAPRVISGYGGGAATPSPSTSEMPARRRAQPQVQRTTSWKPSVQRDRPTTAPSAPAQKPVNTQPPQKAATSAPTAKPRTPKVLPTGFSKATGVFTTMERKSQQGLDAFWNRAPQPLRKVSVGAKGVYSGKMGKFNAIQDTVIVASNISNFFNSKETATELYESYKDKYASVEDADAEVKWQAVSNIITVGADNVLQQLVNRGGQAAVRFVASRMLGYTIGAALGPIGFAVTFLAFAAMDQLMREKTVTEEVNPLISASQSVSEAFTGMTMPGSKVIQNAILPTVSPTLRSIGWSNPDKNSPLDVQAIKMERKPVNYRITDFNENGEVVELEYKIYDNFGRRKDEISTLLDLGYFLTPVTDETGKPVETTWTNPLDPNDTLVYRDFMLDGTALQEWIESTDWSFGKQDIKGRMDGLPKIDPITAQALLKQSLSSNEKNLALESWYNWIRSDATLNPQR